MGAGLDIYLNKLNQAQASGDIDLQFFCLNEIIDLDFKANDLTELNHYLSWMLDLARKNDRLDEELLAMIAYRNLSQLMQNPQDELIWAEQIHDIGEKIMAIKDMKQIRYRHLLTGRKALQLINKFLNQNEVALLRLKGQMG